jgi:hypothetical protein
MLQVVIWLSLVPSCAEAHHLRPLYSNVERRIDQAGRPCARGRVSRVFDHKSGALASYLLLMTSPVDHRCSGEIPDLDLDLDGRRSAVR